MSSTLQLGKSLLEHKFLVQPTRISMISVPNLQTHTGFGQQKYKHQMHKTKGGTQLNLHHFFFFGYRYLHILLKGKIAANSCLPKTYSAYFDLLFHQWVMNIVYNSQA
jgi:hypothetical protein